MKAKKAARPNGRASGSAGRGTAVREQVAGEMEVTPRSRKTWQELLAEIHARGEELEACRTDHWDIWYRGHPNRHYPLLPSLFRGYPDPNEGNAWDHIWAQEQDLYWEFASRARELHGVIEEDWDILFAMQHYGAPTRLLDWTETLAVGVYFALHRFSGTAGEPVCVDPNDPPCIWLLNPYELNVRSCGGKTRRDLFDPKNLGWDDDLREYFGYSDLFLEGGMDFDLPIAVYPRQRTTRMQVQRGWFTIHGDEFVPLDELSKHKRFLRRVDIPAEAEPAAREYLHSAGIELFTLFPDLPNLAAHLNRQNAAERLDFLRVNQ